jgi:hypothetical protein
LADLLRQIHVVHGSEYHIHAVSLFGPREKTVVMGDAVTACANEILCARMKAVSRSDDRYVGICGENGFDTLGSDFTTADDENVFVLKLPSYE